MPHDATFATRRYLRACPVTVSVVIVAVGLHLAVWVVHALQADDVSRAFRTLGAVRQLRWVERHELTGPFDLWRGEWWRVPVTAMHHTDPLQLLLCVAALFYLGGLLEPRLRRRTFLLLLLTALIVPLLPRLFARTIWMNRLLAPDTAGLAGVVFVLFGLALVLRDRDDDLARRLPVWAIAAGLGWLMACLALEAFAGLPVDNLAHLTGLLYGWTAGHVLTNWGNARQWARPVFWGAHAGVPVLLFLLIHPTWNGRYHWWLAMQATDPAERRREYSAAVAVDPGLPWPWHGLAQDEQRRGNLAEAWRTALAGLRHNRSFTPLEKLTQDIWRQMASIDVRRAALDALAETFPGEEANWQDRLISQQHLARHYLGMGDYRSAWRAVLRELAVAATLPPSQADEAERLARHIWSHFGTPAERRAALRVLADILGLQRRRWHLRLIPPPELIDYYEDVGELLWAWQAVLETLREQPASTAALARATSIWQQLPTDLRRQRARRMLERMFDQNWLDWQLRLGIVAPGVLESWRLDQPVRLPAEFLGQSAPTQPRSQSAPAIDPQAPHSARFGEAL